MPASGDIDITEDVVDIYLDDIDITYTYIGCGTIIMVRFNLNHHLSPYRVHCFYTKLIT